MDEFRLQLLQPRFCLLTFREVADEAGKITLVAGLHFADGELHGKRRSILALADDHSADADDPPLSGLQITIQIAVVVFTIWRGHHDLDVLADHLFGGVAEQPLSGRAERLHDAAFVDHDHGVRHGIEDRLDVRFARRGFPALCADCSQLAPSRSPNQEMPIPSAVNVNARARSTAKVDDETLKKLEYSPVR